MHQVTRRAFSTGACAAAVAACQSQPELPIGLVSWEDDLFAAQLVDRGFIETTASRGLPSALKNRVTDLLKNPTPATRPVWFRNSIDHPDFAHLTSVPQPSNPDLQFRLTATVLQSLCSSNDYAPVVRAEDAALSRGRLASGSNKVLFGIRGCVLVGEGPQRGTSLRLLESEPNHKNMRCVLGVWDTESDELFAFDGSTTPNQVYVLGQALHLGDYAQSNDDHAQITRLVRAFGKCDVRVPDLATAIDRLHANLPPTGLHTVVVGPHLRNWRPKPNSPCDPRQPAVFTQHSLYPTLRAFGQEGVTEVGYSFASTWDTLPRSYGNNIHAAYPKGSFADYDSAGCQVIEGYHAQYNPGARRDAPSVEAQGQFRAFRIAAGLSETPRFVRTPQTWNDSIETHDDGNLFFAYLLTTGRELRLHAVTPGTSIEQLRRLRIGSQGPKVRELCAALKSGPCPFYSGRETDFFGHSVATALLNWQTSMGGGRADGIVTEDVADMLGFKLRT